MLRASFWNFAKKIRYDVALVLLTLFFCWFFVGERGPFAAKVDWFSQHSVFPDYFRRLFYETGDFFPEFAANIGGGQNIYHFSYYGLYSPIILLSYLLPFVKMSSYLMAVSVIGLAASAVIFYRWLLSRGYSEGVSFGCALLLVLSGPMIYQSCKQIMFVNYMPFLCMGLFGVDRHLEKGRSGLLAVSVWLMILTSFYFAVGGMFMLAIYGVYAWLRRRETGQTGELRAEELRTKERQTEELRTKELRTKELRTKEQRTEDWQQDSQQQEKRQKETSQELLRDFVRDGVRFAVPFIVAVMFAGILLVPTVIVLASRGESGQAVALRDLLLPKIPVVRMIYSGYSIGQTTLLVAALFTGITYKKASEKMLHLTVLVVLTIPLFTYLLNGGLYERDKVWIPFLPLCVFMIAVYVRKFQQKELSFWQILLPYAVTMLLIVCDRNPFFNEIVFLDTGREKRILLVGECVFFLVIGLCNRKFCRSVYLLLPSIAFLFVFHDVNMRTNITLLEPEFYEQITDPRWEKKIRELAANEEGFYRMEQGGNAKYKEANINRIWSMGQYGASVYSSAFNEEYRDFRRDTFLLEETFRNNLMQGASENPVFQQVMGIKYRLTLTGKGKIRVNIRHDVAPVIYATDRLLSEQDYRTLDFPYNQLVLQSYAVAEDVGETSAEPDWRENLQKRVLEFPVSLTGTESAIVLPIAIESQGNKNTTFSSAVNERNGNENTALPFAVDKGNEYSVSMLFVRFDVDNKLPNRDVTVWINGVRNKQTSPESTFYNNENTTFTYGLSVPAGKKSMSVSWSDGTYEISGARAWLAADPQENGLYQSAFLPDKKKTKGDRIVGTIDVKRPGMLVTSIPYDEGFEILIDGKKVKKEHVNTAFLGTRIEAGEHEIMITYHAPGVTVGKCVSLVGILCLFVMFWIQRGHRFWRKNKRDCFFKRAML